MLFIGTPFLLRLRFVVEIEAYEEPLGQNDRDDDGTRPRSERSPDNPQRRMEDLRVDPREPEPAHDPYHDRNEQADDRRNGLAVRLLEFLLVAEHFESFRFCPTGIIATSKGMLPFVCIFAGFCGVLMRLKIQKHKGREYLSVVQNYRQGGKTKTRTIETIGYADAFAASYDDPIAHFRAYVDQLNEDEAARKRPIELSFAHDDSIASAETPSARLGAGMALGCLDAIGVRDFFRARSGREGFRAHEGRVFEMLATERMMHATSKRESWTARASFPRACDFSFEDVYAALPCFAREETHLDAAFLRSWSRIGGAPDVIRIFLICGSYAFLVDGGSQRASIAVALDANTMPIGYHAFEGRIGPRFGF